MEKIPTVFLRDETDRRFVTDVVNPEAAWVFTARKGLQVTRKFDGTCVMFNGERWFARRQVKKGKVAPANFTPVHFDEITGHTMGWEPIEQSPFYDAFKDALSFVGGTFLTIEPGTYELIGPKINGNPEGTQNHLLINHKHAFDYNYGGGIRPITIEWLVSLVLDLKRVGVEGVVIKHEGRMAKLKGRDFK